MRALSVTISRRRSTIASGGERPWHLISPYDVDGFDDQVTKLGEHNDALLDALGEELAERTPPFAQALPAPNCEVREVPFGGEHLGVVRRILTTWAGEERLAAEPTEELVLAVNELATNSVRHGGGRGRLLLWRETDMLVCEIQDSGQIDDPLIGRSPPAPNQHTGRGLWLVHQLCDLVQIHSSTAGTAVRVHKRAMAAEGGA
jgi:anti-sigma regulatory factor (Ser/Thr protein kinase)